MAIPANASIDGYCSGDWKFLKVTWKTQESPNAVALNFSMGEKAMIQAAYVDIGNGKHSNITGWYSVLFISVVFYSFSYS